MPSKFLQQLLFVSMLLLYIPATQATDINLLISNSPRGDAASQFLLARHYSANKKHRGHLILSYALIQTCAPNIGAEAFKLQIELSKLLTNQEKEIAYGKAISIQQKENVFSSSLATKEAITPYIKRAPIKLWTKEDTQKGITRYIIKSVDYGSLPISSENLNSFKVKYNVLMQAWSHKILKYGVEDKAAETILLPKSHRLLSHTSSHWIILTKEIDNETHLRFLSDDLKNYFDFDNFQKKLWPVNEDLKANNLVFSERLEKGYYTLTIDQIKNNSGTPNTAPFKEHTNTIRQYNYIPGKDSIQKNNNLYLLHGYTNELCFSVLSNNFQKKYYREEIGIPKESICSGMSNIGNNIWISANYDSVSHNNYLLKYSINESTWEIIGDRKNIPYIGVIFGNYKHYLLSYTRSSIILTDINDFSTTILRVNSIFKNSSLPFNRHSKGTDSKTYRLKNHFLENGNIWTSFQAQGYLIYYKIPISRILKHGNRYDFKA